MSQQNKLTIYINGMRYAIKTGEDTAYVEDLSKDIDAMVRELMLNGATSMNEALVLVALSYLDEYKKAEHNADNLRAQVTGYVEDAAKARLEANELKREVERLEKQLGATAGKR